MREIQERRRNSPMWKDEWFDNGHTIRVSTNIPIIFTEKCGFDHIGNMIRLDHDRAHTVADMCPESREP